MKASKVFYKTLKHIMNGVDTIFSLGFNDYSNNDLLIPLLLLGKLAKYIIGFPLGLFLGGLAAITVSIINLFKAEKKQKRVEGESSDFVEDSNDTSSESFEPIINKRSDLSNSEDEFSLVETVYEPGVTVKSNIVKNKFEQSVFLNKQSNLVTKVDLLVQFIGKKITLLNSNYEKHIAVQKRCSSLKSDLFYERSIAETAQIISHYNTHTEKKVSCLVGCLMA